MLKKFLKKIITLLFLIIISNNAYAEMIIERSVGGKNPYGKIIDNTYHKFWVIADKYSEMIGVKKHRELAFEAIKMMDECLDVKDTKFEECTPVVFEERNKMRRNDNSDEAFLNNPILAYKSSVFYAGLMSLQIYGTDKLNFHKSWKENGLIVLDSYVNSIKKVILDELVKKLDSNNIEVISLKENKKNIDKKIKLYNDFFVTIPNYYGDIGNNSVYEKKIRRLLAENKKMNRANSDLKKL